MKLFLSHATEDQEAIASPLNEILKESFEVYYFPESIIPGQSQFESISGALNDCDYGVVILSPDYLRKYWTRAELYARWARRMTESRDVIIPVWWRVTAADVKKLSPLLIDPNAITSGTPERIAEEIKVAIGTAFQERKRWDRKLQLAESIRLRKAANAAYLRLARTREGSELIYQEWKFIEERCKNLVEECGLKNAMAINSKDTPFLRFFSASHGGFTQEIFNSLVLRFDLENLAANSIAAVKLKSRIRLEHRDGYSQRYEHQIISGSELDLVPKFDDRGSPVWENPNRELKLTVMVVDERFEKFLDALDKSLSGIRLTARAPGSDEI